MSIEKQGECLKQDEEVKVDVGLCYFSTGICGATTCCKDGEFNDNGYPINECPCYPCEKYKNNCSLK